MRHLAFIAASVAAFCIVSPSDAQNRTSQGYPVSGRVIDHITRESVPYAAVIIVGLEGPGTVTDSSGVFTIPDVRPGIVQFAAIQLGYRTVS